MHIPASMLNGKICPVTLAVGAIAVAMAVHHARRSEEKPSAARFAAVTSLIFALQMLNYPVQNGTSGHLVGAMLGVSLLGISFSILAMAIVLAVQAFFFGDGGVNALGANILNMGILAAGLCGILFDYFKRKNIPSTPALGIASWLSVMIGAAACSLEVAISGAVTLQKALTAMLSVHALIGIGEGLLTVAVVGLLNVYARAWKENERSFAFGAVGLAVFAAMMSPFASSFPDGLEWVAEKLSFAEFSGLEIPALFPDYQATFLHSAYLSTAVAGLIGTGLVFGLTFALAKAINKKETFTV